MKDYMGDVHSEDWRRIIFSVDPELEDVLLLLKQELEDSKTPLGGRMSWRLIFRQLAEEAGRL